MEEQLKQEERRIKNRIASANCRQRKVDQAKALKAAVIELEHKVTLKKISIMYLEKQIEEYVSRLEMDRSYLSSNDKWRIIELIGSSSPFAQLLLKEMGESTVNVTDLETTPEEETNEPLENCAKKEEKVADDKENIALVTFFNNQKFMFPFK